MTVEKIPKIVLHLHLDGSIDINDAYQWAKKDGYNYTKKELVNKLQVNQECQNLNDYLKKFDLPCKLLQSCERLEIAAYHLFKKLAALNVIYAEVRFAPNKHLEKNLTLDDVIISVINGFNKANVETGIMGGIILSLMRGDILDNNKKVIDIAKKYLNKGILGLDLAGAESIYPTKDYIELFNYAKKLKIPFTIHAGEASGAESIIAALNMETKRIGHGIRAVENENLLESLKRENVLLEICVTSNYQTEAIKGKHPIEILFKKGIKISINTDNDTVSNININQEYKKILNETNMSIDDLIKCNIDSIPYIFAEDSVKIKLKNLYDNVIKK